MAQVLQRRRDDAVPVEPALRPRTSWRQDLVTTLLSAWMLAGGASDAWAHVHQKPDTFFTPWHAVIYSGLVALASWMLWLSIRGGEGQRFSQRVPVGYGLGLIGALLLLPGSVGDGVWHTVFGIEVSLEALLSPTHMLLFVGGLLMFSAPVRAAWLSTRPGGSPALGAFLPALLSLTVTTAFITVFLGHASAFQNPSPTTAVSPSALMGTLDFYVIEQGFMDIQATNLLLLSPLLLALRRWRLPFGTATVLFTIPAVLAVAIWSLTDGWPRLLAALAGGLVADWCITRSRPAQRAADGRRAHLLVATVTPLVLWSAYFLLLHVQHGLTWSAELWTGSILFAVLGGYALHLLIAPPRMPPAAERG